MVEANRVRLLSMLGGLMLLVGPGLLRRVIRRALLRQILTLESAVRRLIYVAARDMRVTLRASAPPLGAISGRPGADNAPVFALIEAPRRPEGAPRRTAPGHGPRILFLDEERPADEWRKPTPDDLMETTALRRRLGAMKAALDDLPKQARRLARWFARQERTRGTGRFARLYPIRSGRAPGHREDGKGDVDAVLADCHDLALRAREMIEGQA